MATDWAATGQMVAGLGSFAGAGAVAYAAWRATETVEGWRTKKVGERKFEHAERTLAATYRVREATKAIRSRLVHGVEYQKAQQELEAEAAWPSIPLERRERFATAQAIVRRIRLTESDWDGLVDCLPMTRALFDAGLEQALSDLLRQRTLISLFLDEYVETDPDDRDANLRLRRTIFGNLDDGDDAVSLAIREAVEVIEAKCLPILRVE